VPPRPWKSEPRAVATEAATSGRGGNRNGEPTAADGKKPRPYDDLLRDSLAYAIKRTQVRCDEALARYLDPGLSPARFAALCAVGANPGISQAALGGLLNIGGPSVVKVVDELERMQLVERTPSSDRRVYALLLTELGGTHLKRYQGSIHTFEKKISSMLAPQERALLLALLAKVAPDEA
jgi:DNA-binding MarR family transcriptional regulator